MTLGATRRRLLSTGFAAAGLIPRLAFAQDDRPLPNLPRLPRAPRLPFTHRDPSEAPPPAPILSGPKPDLAGILAETGAPAIAAAAVTAHDTEFFDAVGMRRVGERGPVTPEDLWHLGGCTQTFTAAACARLVEKGRLSLSTRMPALFPGMALDPAWSEVRLEDVLAHRAGFTDAGVITVDRVAKARADARPAPLQRHDLAVELLKKPPAHTPGGFEPSYVGYVIVAAALERLTSTSYEGVVDDYVFTPLAMKTAGFGAPSTGEGPSGHQLGQDGKLHPTPSKEPADLPPLFASATGAHMSIQDWARFTRVFLNDGGTFLKPETLERLCRPWGGGDEETGASAFQVLGDRAWASGVVLKSQGSNGLWTAQCEIAPERGLAVLSVCNSEEGGGAEAVRRAALLLQKAYGAGVSA